LASARAAFERLPWVRSADVRRQWPGGLEIVLTASMCRWHAGARMRLVNIHGEVFEAAFDGALRYSTDLPVLQGDDHSVQHFRRSLCRHRQNPRRDQLSRGAPGRSKWTTGVTLDLGREHVEERLRASSPRIHGRSRA